MKIALGENRYGKSRVRLMKIRRDAEQHEVFEWNVEIWLSGDFESCFVDGDNSRILPTDTMKNAVYSRARVSSAPTPENFAIELASYFIENNLQIDSASVRIAVTPWKHVEAGGINFATAFTHASDKSDTTTVTLSRAGSPAISAGFEGLWLLKTAKSGFSGYIKDRLTTLKETHDRLLGTLAKAEWKYQSENVDFAALRGKTESVLLQTFAEHESLSVQQTLYAMAKAALAGNAKQAAPDFERLAAQVLHRCAELALATDERGQILRTFLSPAMEDCHRRIREWMESAGMTVAVDRVGNIRGYHATAEESAARLAIASHLDTVPNAGKYDGILGVVLGVALVDALQGRGFGFGIEVIGFSDEEGVRYGLPFIGSRAAIGQLGPPQLARRDGNGVRMASAIAEYGATHPEAIETPLNPQTRGYLEFHIEQGPVLEEAGLALGVVETIAGQSRCTVTFRGRAGHAGTTPMGLRRDALAAAAEWLVAVEGAASATPGLVATSGQVNCVPGAPNVIPGLVRCSLDVRHAQDSIRRNAVASMLASAESIASRRRIEVEHCLEYDQAAVTLDSTLVEIAERTVADAGIEPVRMTSGAGHDAMIIAPHVPSAMIFLRTSGGISHHPDEAVLAEDVAAALRAGLSFLERFGQFLEERRA